MTLFGIGAASVIGMLRLTIQGGQDARRMDIATHIANTWVERLQADSVWWTRPNRDFPGVHNLDQTRWLASVNVGACNLDYCNPSLAPTDAVTARGTAWAFDYLGRERWSGSNDHEFCAQYKMDWIRPLGAGLQLNQDAVIRAEVRVYYARLEQRQVTACGAIALPPSYHLVHAATSIRKNVR